MKNNFYHFAVIGLSSLGMLMSSTIHAAKAHAHADILKTAHDYALQIAQQHHNNGKIHIDTGTLDSRLSLQQCSQPLEAFESPNAKTIGNTTVGVRCDGDKSWKLYVPVKISVMQKVAVLSRGVARNTVISRSDFELQEKDISALHRGYYSKPERLIGKISKTTLRSGTTLTPGHVENPLAIKKGSTVLIVADVSGIQVRMKGKALKSGEIGDWIQVQNLSSNRKIEGKIIKDGIVGVML